MKKIIFSGLAFLPLFLLLSAQDVDLLKLAMEHRDAESGLGVMLHPFGRGWQWRTAKESPSTIVRLPPAAVKGGHRYLLEWTVLPHQFLASRIGMKFHYAGGKSSPWIALTMLQSTSELLRIEKEVLVPPGAEEIEFRLVLDNLKLVGNQNIGYMESMKLHELGPLKSDPALDSFYGKNLLPLSDFSAFSSGETDRAKLKMMPFSQKPFAAEVTSEKNLRIIWRKGDYQYIAWFTEPLPLYGSIGKFKCRLRGHGKVQLMIWWNRPAFPTHYQHFGFFNLTPEWKDYEVELGCDDPLIQKAAVAFACRDIETEFEIARLSYELLK